MAKFLLLVTGAVSLGNRYCIVMWGPSVKNLKPKEIYKSKLLNDMNTHLQLCIISLLALLDY